MACQNNNSPNPAVDTNAVEIPADFPEFYAKFHIDPEFQLNHISFPLDGKEGNQKWEAAEWTIHKPFDTSEKFKRDIENFQGIITETLIDESGLFYLVRRFAKLGGEWNLIFYETGTKLDGFKSTDQ